jgi:anti-sigma factor RsiW
MADLDRVIGGLRCRDVLERLSAYLDGELTGAELTALETHARSCDQCGRFGGRFGAVVTALRQTATVPADDAGRSRRLADRLVRELGR